MAKLAYGGVGGGVIHGDLNESNAPLSRPIYVRPVFLPKTDRFDGTSREEVPDDRLLVDLIHRAVRRIVATDDPDGAAAR